MVFDNRTIGGCTIHYVRIPVTDHCASWTRPSTPTAGWTRSLAIKRWQALEEFHRIDLVTEYFDRARRDVNNH